MLSTLFSLPIAEIEYLNGSQTIMRIVLFFIFTALTFILGAAGHANGRAPSWAKWLSLVPCVLWLLWAKQYFDYAMDSFIVAAGQIGGNSAFLYKVAFIVPVVLLPVLIFGCVISTRKINDYKTEL